MSTKYIPLNSICQTQLESPSAIAQVPDSKNREEISFLREGLDVKFEDCFVTQKSLNPKTARTKTHIKINRDSKTQQRELGLMNKTEARFQGNRCYENPGRKCEFT